MVGAGDSLMGAIVLALSGGASFKQAVRAGTAAAAAAVTTPRDAALRRRLGAKAGGGGKGHGSGLKRCGAEGTEGPWSASVAGPPRRIIGRARQRGGRRDQERLQVARGRRDTSGPAEQGSDHIGDRSRDRADGKCFETGSPPCA
ncbi:PfkB family carbohydrate kinase [Limimaricola cinnabarinus]|uniref:PfkB family carbohydrate kinase n=1 Tax=Limimaricola cinnabarinus TaxID=1125964 RepID=UPI0034E2BBB1